jgi:hypothetical protein
MLRRAETRPPSVLWRPPNNIAMNIRPEVFGPLAPHRQEGQSQREPRGADFSVHSRAIRYASAICAGRHDGGDEVAVTDHFLWRRGVGCALGRPVHASSAPRKLGSERAAGSG